MSQVAFTSLFRERRQVFGWLMLLLLAAPMARVVARADDSRPVTTVAMDEHSEALRRWYLEISRKMAGGNARAKEEGLSAFLPTREEIEGLFGKLAQKIWPVHEERFSAVRAEIEEFFASSPPGIVRLKAIHLEHADEQQGYGASLKFISAGTPVLRLVKTLPEWTSGVSASIWTGKRGARIPSFSEFPKLAP